MDRRHARTGAPAGKRPDGEAYPGRTHRATRGPPLPCNRGGMLAARGIRSLPPVRRGRPAQRPAVPWPRGGRPRGSRRAARQAHRRRRGQGHGGNPARAEGGRHAHPARGRPGRTPRPGSAAKKTLKRARTGPPSNDLPPGQRVQCNLRRVQGDDQRPRNGAERRPESPTCGGSWGRSAPQGPAGRGAGRAARGGADPAAECPPGPQ